MLARSAASRYSSTLRTTMPSATRKTSTAASASAKPLYAAQASLPHLPVPTLDSTFAKYLETLEPLQTADEHAKSRGLIRDFLSSPLSSTLQGRLEARAAAKDSWLSEWWNEVAYMGYRGRIVPNVSYFYVHKRGLGQGASQEDRAAELVRSTVDFKKLVDSEMLEPERGKGGPLCSASYKYLFNAVRVPAQPADIPLAYPPNEHHHVVVVRNNRYFIVDTKGRGKAELADAFRKVKEMADGDEGSGLGVLCADDRDVWTDVRRHVMSLSKNNTAGIQAIESAILLVCLDDGPAPKDLDETSWSYWSGGRSRSPNGQGWNRWFDKHAIVVDANGETGFNGEHSMLDGTPTLRLNEFMVGAVAQGKIPLELPEAERNTAPMPAPAEIVFDLDHTTRAAIAKSKDGFGEEMAKQQLKMVHFTGYGKNAIKAHKTSPDAWAQMIKQLAFYRHKGRPGVTYESCQTRKFLLGRTEVIRSCSQQALEFVQAMQDTSGKTTDKEREAKFRKAVARHIQYSSWAADGQGVDRHMFGLRMLVDKDKGEQMPEVFTEKVFGQSCHWEMSTSQLSSKWLDGWGYGEVVDDGYGLSYALEDDALRWCITTKNNDADEFARQLEQAALDVRAMMDRAKQA